MSPRIFILCLLLIVVVLIVREQLTERPKQLYQLANGQVEMCLSCHKEEKLDQSHDTKILGCSSCHLGDALAIKKETAHHGIVRNPGDLRVVEQTCGVEGCHAPDVKLVKNSLMATNRGILATLLYYWGEAPDQNGNFSVKNLIDTGETSLAIDYYRKLCGTCHLWKQKGDLPGFFGTKGGGCTACHYIAAPVPEGADPKKIHPHVTKKVPVENCVRCHNRSSRIGISYTGVYESEGYGTPYEDGGLSSKQLPGDRFYQDLPADVHHQKGMVCQDCHTRSEIMGDGNNYVHYEQAMEISCKICHTTEIPGTTRKDNKLNNIEQTEQGYVLVGKLDQKKHPLKPPKPEVCDSKGHSRMTCESCHSPWVPQCYGCHVKRDMRETHLDKLTLKETPGWWEEGRSYLRYERPVLALYGDKVVTTTPGCQDIVTLIDEQGNVQRKFNNLTMAALNPHTTQAKGMACKECHINTKAMGLGEGTAWKENGEWHFKPLYQAVETDVGTTPPLDAFVTIDGKPLQKSFRHNLRPFNKEELARILRVGQCLSCHKDYSDPIYATYTTETKCPVFKED